MSGFLTINQFIDRYAVGRTTLYSAVRKGELKIVKLGRASRIPVEEAERWAASLPAKGEVNNG